MAIKNVNTINSSIEPDQLEEALTRIQYAHSLAALLTEQRDFHKLPPHQQQTIHSLLFFTHEAESAISGMINSTD
ncbi:TPA: hypothetical protein U5D87_004687 [Yersinia enterocolitica]|nr:hypothetical protein [Yersinia enterocolitica]